MALFRNQAEPFEESQGDSAASISPDALKAFYSDMERKELAQRKLSRTKSSSGRSLWSRKSTKKQPGAIDQDKLQTLVHTVQKHQEETQGEMQMIEELKEKPDQLSSLLTRSIIPDPLGELPAWFGKGEERRGQNSYRTKYPIHNPVGPKWYKNQHLIPPSQLRAASRPPSVFSPSFPPMASSASTDKSEDATRLPGPSRTPSGSPSPTPNSSQTRIVDSIAKPRARKTSQTAHDNVDMLDVSDPWGTSWHHQSPYDAGLSTSPVSVDSPEGSNVSRGRVNSMNNGRHKTVTPSPLSQSTSAVHLQAPEMAYIPRKLSKRRKPIIGGLFSRNPEESRLPASAPVSPTDNPPTKAPSSVPSSASSSVVPAHVAGEKKGKRGSVLGRLARKFSVLRKQSPHAVEGSASTVGEDWHHIQSRDTTSRDSRQSGQTQRQASPEKPGLDARRITDPLKRVPPPLLADSLQNQRPPAINNGQYSNDAGARSSMSVSLDEPFSMGRLTVANPDLPNSSGDTPVREAVLLPSDSLVSPPEDAGIGSSGHDLEAELPPLPSDDRTSTTDRSSHSSTNISDQPKPTDTSAIRMPTPDELVVAPSQALVTDSSPSIASAVPFPSAEENRLSDARTSYSSPVPITTSPLHVDDSPLSKASILANPPTPYLPPTAMPPPASPTVPSPSQEKLPARDPSPTKARQDNHAKEESQHTKRSSSSTRQTETFKLVRSASGHMQTGATFTAEGQQWEVVESDSHKRSKTRDSTSKSRESSSRREQRRQEKAKVEAEVEQLRTKSQVRQKSANGHAVAQLVTVSSSASRKSRTRSLDVPPRPALAQPSLSFQDEGTSKKNRNDDTDRGHNSGTNGMNKPQPSRQTPAPVGLERRPSNSVRPTSELPSTAELNAMRAKEVWDMERLWKGRSMYHGAQVNGAMTSVPSTDTDAVRQGVNGDLVKDDASPQNASHGSSHTSFVSVPFHGQSSSLPAVPLTVHSSAGTPQRHLSTSSVTYDHPNTYRSFSDPYSSNTKDVITDSASAGASLANPLPEPPRESSYEPARLPPTFASPTRTSTEYFKYTGITTAH